MGIAHQLTIVVVGTVTTLADCDAKTRNRFPVSTAVIRPQTCPICKKNLTINSQVDSALFPFCSERCQQIDLYRWSEGKYAIVEPIDSELIDAEQDSDESMDQS